MTNAVLKQILRPTKSLVASTLSADGTLITDRQRIYGLQGDGLLNDGSTGIWPAVTNICSNPTFETNDTGWGVEGTSTKTRVTTSSKFGSVSLQCSYSGSGLAEGLNYGWTGNVATAYALSLWAKYVSGAGNRVLKFGNYDDGQGSLYAADVTLPASGAWTRLTYQATSPTPFTTPFLIVRGLDGTSWVFQIDGVQIEASVVVTPFAPTTRAAGRVQVPTQAFQRAMATNRFWVAACFRTLPAFDSQNHGIFSVAIDDTHWLGMYQNAADGKLIVQRFPDGVGGSSAAALTQNAINTVIGLWTPTAVQASVNGSTLASTANAGAGIDLSSVVLADIGSLGTLYGGLPNLHGDMFMLMAGQGLLSNGDAAMIHTLMTRQIKNLNAYPGNPIILFDGTSPEVMQVRQ